MFKKIFLFLVTVMFILGMSNLSFAMSCGHNQETTLETKSAPEGFVNVGNKICPVTGEKIDERVKAAYEYNGKIYNFCCASCIEMFKENVDKYIQKVNKELNP